MSKMKEMVLDALSDNPRNAKSPDAIRRIIYPKWGHLRQEAGRLAAVSRALGELGREGLVYYKVPRIPARGVVPWCLYWKVDKSDKKSLPTN